MTPFVRALARFVLAAVVAGLAAPARAESLALDGTAWVLESLPRVSLVADPRVTLRFAAGRASGSDGCNRYTTSFSQDGATLRFSPRAAATQMACPAGVSALADAVHAALADTRGARMAGPALELTGADGAVLATFAPQSDTLAGTSWKVTAYNNGRQAVVSLLSGTTLTIAFAADGRVAGSAGCNRYTGRFVQARERLSLSAIAATRKACAEPAKIMEQEAAFLKALSTVSQARFEGDRLELRSDTDALAATLVRVGKP